MLKLSQGSRANLTGLALENLILSYCQYYGLITSKRVDMSFVNLYGTRARVPVYISPHSVFPKGLVCELMAQEGKGSATWKIPGKIWNIVECYPCPGVIILAGNSLEMESARAWAKGQVNKEWHINGRHENLLGVFTPGEFRVWLRDCVKAGRYRS